MLQRVHWNSEFSNIHHEQIGLRKYSKYRCLNFWPYFQMSFLQSTWKIYFQVTLHCFRGTARLYSNTHPYLSLSSLAPWNICHHLSLISVHISAHVTYTKVLVLFCVVLRSIKIEKISLQFTYTIRKCSFLLQRCFKLIVFFFFVNHFLASPFCKADLSTDSKPIFVYLR